MRIYVYVTQFTIYYFERVSLSEMFITFLKVPPLLRGRLHSPTENLASVLLS